jgi:hypothetical protein
MKPSLKKPRDFTVAEGHGHPLVIIIMGMIQTYFNIHKNSIVMTIQLLVI